MELLLRVEPQPDLGMPVDLVVEVDADDRVDTLVCLLMRALHLDPSVCVSQLVISIARTGIALAPESMIADVSIMSGDSVVLEVLNQKSTPLRLRQRAVPQKPVAAIDILSGSDAGALVPLVPGQYLIGSGDNCAIRIADAKVLTHHLIVRVEANGRLMLADAGDNGITFVDGAPLGEPRQVDLDDLVMIGETAFKFQPGNYERERDRFGMIPHNRTPYHPVVVVDRTLDQLVAPPKKPERQRFRATIIIAPLMMGVIGYVVFQRVAMVLFAGVGLFAAIYGFFDDKRYGKGKFVKDTKAWRERLGLRAKDVHDALDAELSERLRSTPDVSECANRAHYRQPRLWERDTTHADFLRLRIGVGEVESLVNATIAKGGEDDLAEEGTKALEFQSKIFGAPVSVSFRGFGVIGIEGDIERAESMACALLIQAATLHSPEELVIAGAFPEQTRFDWLKWLPHTRSVTSPIEGAHLSIGAEDGRELISRLGDVISTRAQSKKMSNAEVTYKPHILLVLHESANLDPVALAQLLDIVPHVGASVLWIGLSQSALPRQCTATLSVGSGGRQGVLRFVDPKRKTVTLSVETSTHDAALSVARALAPVREVSAGSAASSIPRTVDLFSNLDLVSPTPEALIKRWSMAQPATLYAPIGQSSDGLFVLDLVEQGPHGLIAGTSGAGKSELLQTLVAGLSATYSPSQLNFLFVDYKGGAAVQDFIPLPHAVGFVTDLDMRLALRALASLRAELKRREHLLEGKAKDIVELEKLFPGDAPPRLVIVVDEFATLVKEIPDFVAGIVDVAQRGRSLGIHLILATQRPAGAVSDNILANTNLRIALRVLDASDSSNVLGSPAAASIPVPLRGRAFARTGTREVTAFQTAYSGGQYHVEAVGRSVSYSIFGATEATVSRSFSVDELIGAADTPSRNLDNTIAAATPSAPTTQLQALVRLAGEAARQINQAKQRKPWLEPLPALLSLEACVIDAIVDAKDPARVVTIGRKDLPKEQAQPLFSIDFETDAGLLIFGSGGSGKTTALQMIANSLALTASPAHAWVYAIDCAGRRLASIADLPNVGAVVFGDEVERITRLISLLNSEVERRSRLLADRALASVGEFNTLASDENRIPRIVLLVDNWQSLNSTFENMRLGMSPKRGTDWIDDIKRLIVDGRPTGVHFVIASPSESLFPSAITSALGRQLRLRSTGENLLAIKRDAIGELRSGQGMLGEVEVQLALLGTEGSGAGQAAAVATLAKNMQIRRDEAIAADSTTELRLAPGIHAMAREVSLPEVLAKFEQQSESLLKAGLASIPVGIGDCALDVAVFDLERSHAVISGSRRSGKSTTLATVAQSIWSSRNSKDDLQLWGIGNEEFVASRVFDQTFAHADDVGEALASHEASNGARIVIFVDDAEQLDKSTQDLFEAHARRVRPGGVRLVAAFDVGQLRGSYSRAPWLTEIVRGGQGILLGPDFGDSPILGSQQSWADIRPGVTFGPGRGFLVRESRTELVQVAMPVLHR